MDIVLFGIQGSGKGTVGKTIAGQFGFKIFETGSALRNLAQENSELGQKVKSIIEAGHLVPNEVVIDIIRDFMNKLVPGEKALFDGIPRKMEQAESFDQIMKENHRDFRGIFIEIPDEVAVKRLLTRRICKLCKSVYPAAYEKPTCTKCNGELVTRSDDNPESIKNRLQAYFDETMPVIKHYEKLGKMMKVNGDQSMENVAYDIANLIKQF